jgi:AraC-like DNA-binding protein
VLAARAEAVVARRLHERDLSASRVAAALDVNADYLTRALKAARGLTLTDLIHRRRLKEARAMLLDGAANAKQVAARCGFADAAYLRRLFKRHEGVTPAQFRRLYARTHVNVR